MTPPSNADFGKRERVKECCECARATPIERTNKVSKCKTTTKNNPPQKSPNEKASKTLIKTTKLRQLFRSGNGKKIMN